MTEPVLLWSGKCKSDERAVASIAALVRRNAPEGSAVLSSEDVRHDIVIEAWVVGFFDITSIDGGGFRIELYDNRTGVDGADDLMTGLKLSLQDYYPET